MTQPTHCNCLCGCREPFTEKELAYYAELDSDVDTCLCAICEREERDADDEADRWADEHECNGYPFGTIGAETR
jgi:hypothetical protein